MKSRKPPFKQSPAYAWYRGVQKPFAFKAWAKRNPDEAKQVQARFTKENA